jgi:hypothetical protein
VQDASHGLHQMDVCVAVNERDATSATSFH